MNIPLRSLGAVAVAACLTASFACSGNDKASGVAGAKLPQGSRSEGLEHEACNESGNRVETLDTNNDGKSDIRRVYDKSTGHEVCRIVDLNHDGKPDLYEYFDSSGVVRRRELCFDDSGVVNAIEYYDNGKLVRREYDTTGQHRIDTWDYFDGTQKPDAKGRIHPSKRERDTTGDGRIDQWWTWDGDKVTIAMDKSGDGKPDPEATVVLGGSTDDGGAAPAPPSAPATDDAGSAPSAAKSTDAGGAQ
jgi:hypothetical protein